MYDGGMPAKKIEINMDDLVLVARTGATNAEMASRLGISHSTFDERLKDPDFRQIVEDARNEVKVSLRAKQVAMALAGDRTMLIWLGKQWLGQKERNEISGVGAGGSIVVDDASASSAREQILGKLAEYARTERAGSGDPKPN